MAKQLQIRGGTTVQHSTFTGALREITIDTDKDVVVVHDGTTVGGFPLAKQTSVDSKVTKVTSTDNAIVRFNGATGDVQNSGVIIDDNNNVGIGITPSTWGSGVKAQDIGLGTAIANIGSYVTSAFAANCYNEGVWKYKNNEVASLYEQQGNHKWYTAPSGTAGNPITWTNAMTLDASGNLRLGTFNAAHNVISKASGDDYVVSIVNTSTTGESYNTRLRNESSSTSGYYLVCESPVGLKAGVLNDGSFLSATGSYGQTSDIKLKENINDASPKLDKLMQVKIKTFNYIGQEEKQIGVIAQEIEQIFPSLVFETKDTKDVEVEKEREIPNEDGTVNIEKYTETQTVETGEVTKNVKYSILYTLMLKGMQEQQAIINDLKARIEILEEAK